MTIIQALLIFLASVYVFFATGCTSLKGFHAPGFTVFYETKAGTFETTYRPSGQIIQPTK